MRIKAVAWMKKCRAGNNAKSAEWPKSCCHVEESVVARANLQL